MLLFMEYVRLVNKPDLKKVLKDNYCVDSFENINEQLSKRMNTCDINGIFFLSTAFYEDLDSNNRPLAHLYFQIRKDHLNGVKIIPFQGDIIEVLFYSYKTLPLY